MLEGTWCEDTCTDPDSPVSKAIKLQPGDCQSLGFTAREHEIEGHVFVKDTAVAGSDLEFAVQGGDTVDGCNMHYKEKNGMCECFCLGAESKGYHYTHVAEDVGAMKKGKCDDGADAYANYIGKKVMTVWAKPADVAGHDGSEDDKAKANDKEMAKVEATQDPSGAGAHDPNEAASTAPNAPPVTSPDAGEGTN